jgi:hypothetical protein
MIDLDQPTCCALVLGAMAWYTGHLLCVSCASMPFCRPSLCPLFMHVFLYALPVCFSPSMPPLSLSPSYTHTAEGQAGGQVRCGAGDASTPGVVRCVVLAPALVHMCAVHAFALLGLKRPVS